MIPGDVQDAVTVDRDTNRVVSVRCVAFELSFAELPGSRIEFSFRQNDTRVGVVEGSVLSPVKCREGVAPEDYGIDLIAGPTFSDWDQTCGWI